MMRTPVRLLADESGASVIEMGLAAPLLATFLIGMLDLSGAYSAKLSVEQAAQRTIEMVQRNGFGSGQEATLKTEAETAAGAGSSATVTASLECTSGDGTVTSKAFTGTCSDGDSQARYIHVAITKPYKPYLPIKWGGNANGTYTIHGSAGLRIQ